MSKVKAVIIVVIVLLFFSMGVSIQILSRKYQQEKSDKERLWNNNIELSATGKQQGQHLIYTKDEFIRVMSDSLRTALDELQIKPKEVTKIIYRTITDIDTVDRPVYVDYRRTHWMVADTGKCFIWSGMAFLSDTILKGYQDRLQLLQWFSRLFLSIPSEEVSIHQIWQEEDQAGECS
jgi:hypothetical protein